MSEESIFSDIIGFQWDNGNNGKNWQRHRVSDGEAEEVFFNNPLLVFPDVKHSQKETRQYCLGQTNSGRALFIAFVVRNGLIRIISARDMNKRERTNYEKTAQKNS